MLAQKRPRAELTPSSAATSAFPSFLSPPASSSFWEPVKAAERQPTAAIVTDADVAAYNVAASECWPLALAAAFSAGDAAAIAMTALPEEAPPTRELGEDATPVKSIQSTSRDLLRVGFDATAAAASATPLRRFAAVAPYTAHCCHLLVVVGVAVRHANTRHLFTDSELKLAAALLSLTPPAAGLLARLTNRTGPWFRTSTLSAYDEFALPLPPSLSPATEAAVTLTDDIGESAVGAVDADDVVDVGSPSALSGSQADVVDDEEPPPPSTTAWPDSAFASGEWLARPRRMGSGEAPGTVDRVQAAVRELIEARMLLPFPTQRELSSGVGCSNGGGGSGSKRTAGTSMPTVSAACHAPATTPADAALLVLEAISALFSVPELKHMLRSLKVRLPAAAAPAPSQGVPTTASAPAGVASPTSGWMPALGPSRADLLRALIHAYQTQRSLLGRLPIAAAAASALEESARFAAAQRGGMDAASAAVGNGDDGGGGSSPFSALHRASPAPATTTTPAAPGSPRTHALVRLAPQIFELVRRCHGLFYLATGTALLSSGAGTGSWPAPLSGSALDRGGLLGSDAESAAATVATMAGITAKEQCRESLVVELLSDSDTGESDSAPMDASNVNVARGVESVAAVAVDVVWESCCMKPVALLHTEADTLVTVATGRLSERLRVSSCEPSYKIFAQLVVMPSGARVEAAPVASIGGGGGDVVNRRGGGGASAWASSGSGSKYADATAVSDSFVPAGAGLAVAPATRGAPKAYQRSTGVASGGASAIKEAGALSAISAGGAMSTGALFSPALLQIFRRLRFTPVVASAAAAHPVFASRRSLLAFEAVHLFRSQADFSAVFSHPASLAAIPVPLGSAPAANAAVQSEPALAPVSVHTPASVPAAIALGSSRDESVILVSDDEQPMNYPVRPTVTRGGSRVGARNSPRAATATPVVAAATRAAAATTAAEGMATAAASKEVAGTRAAAAASVSPFCSSGYSRVDSLHLRMLARYVGGGGGGSRKNSPLPGTLTPLAPPLAAGLQLLLFAPLLIGATTLCAWEEAVSTPLAQAIAAHTPPAVALHGALAAVLRLTDAVCSAAVSSTGAESRSSASNSSADVNVASRLWSPRCLAVDVGAAPLALMLATALPPLLAALRSGAAASGDPLASALAVAVSADEVLATSSSAPAASRTLRARMRAWAIGVTACAPAPLCVAWRASLCLALARSLRERGERHPWLHQLCAGSLAAALLWEAVDPLERGRLHAHTLPLLRQLVAAPFTPHRAGRWWARMCLNASHIGLHADAAALAAAGLLSRRVAAGDRLALAQRGERLDRVLRQKASSVGAASTASASGDAPVDATMLAAAAQAFALAVQQDSFEALQRAEEEAAAAAEAAAASNSSSVALPAAAPLLPADPDMPGYGAIFSAAADADAAAEAAGEAVHRASPARGPWLARVAAALHTVNCPSGGLGQKDSSNARCVRIPLPFALRVDEFTRAPLSSLAGVKSRFVNDFDADNDSDGNFDAVADGKEGAETCAAVGADAGSETPKRRQRRRLDEGSLVLLSAAGDTPRRDLSRNNLTQKPPPPPPPPLPSLPPVREETSESVTSGGGAARRPRRTPAPQRAIAPAPAAVKLPEVAATPPRKAPVSLRTLPGASLPLDPAAAAASFEARSDFRAFRNVTDEVCASFGWTYPWPSMPGRHHFKAPPPLANRTEAPPAASAHVKSSPTDITSRAAAATSVDVDECVGDAAEGNADGFGGSGGGAGDDGGAGDSELVRSSVRTEPSEAASERGVAQSARSTAADAAGAADAAAPVQAPATGRGGGAKSGWWKRRVPEGASEGLPSGGFSPAATLGVEQLALAWYHLHGRSTTAMAVASASCEAAETATAAAGDSSIGWRGMHAEGGPIFSLVALCSWDLLFSSPQPHGAFLTAYQDAPLDLDSPAAFYSRRRDAIKARLQFLACASDAALLAFVGAAWRDNYGCACRGMNWAATPLPLLQLLALGLGGAALACLVDALAANHKQLTGGMPDLLLWRVLVPDGAGSEEPAAAIDAAAAAAHPSTLVAATHAVAVTDQLLHRTTGGGAGENVETPPQLLPTEARRQRQWPDLCLPAGAVVQVRLVEVKGPRDKLSEKQHHWLRILLAAGIAASVVKISEPKPAARTARASTAKSSRKQKQRGSRRGSEDNDNGSDGILVD